MISEIVNQLTQFQGNGLLEVYAEAVGVNPNRLLPVSVGGIVRTQPAYVLRDQYEGARPGDQLLVIDQIFVNGGGELTVTKEGIRPLLG